MAKNSMTVAAVEPKKDSIDKYEVEDAVRTLLRAEEIKADKKLMALVGPEISKKHKAISKISSMAQLRDKANGAVDDQSDDSIDEGDE